MKDNDLQMIHEDYFRPSEVSPLVGNFSIGSEPGTWLCFHQVISHLSSKPVMTRLLNKTTFI